MSDVGSSVRSVHLAGYRIMAGENHTSFFEMCVKSRRFGDDIQREVDCDDVRAPDSIWRR